ncbi:hypothetical protein MW887_001846 [Aspergillus wentii]|nr:hypothetical protein MW887_001846 [Aspergillus wentii]
MPETFQVVSNLGAGPSTKLESGEQPSYGITVVNDPEKATVDIVFVHGLMGNAHRTWYHEKEDVYWPKDLLGADLQDARTMVFGYEVDVWRPWNQVSQESISGYSADLLGCLSGYRRKASQALITARESRDHYLRCIETYTIGICFLGTPHRGASLAAWGGRFAGVVNLVKPTNSQIVRLLEPRSKKLLEIRRAFHNLLEKRKDEGARIRIVCFYETIPMFKSCIVSEESATIDGEPSFPILANHMDMVRFSGHQDNGYKSISREIQQIIIDKDMGYVCPNCDRRWRADLIPGAPYFCPFCGRNRSDWNLYL